jgi:hypothetical protein
MNATCATRLILLIRSPYLYVVESFFKIDQNATFRIRKIIVKHSNVDVSGSKLCFGQTASTLGRL